MVIKEKFNFLTQNINYNLENKNNVILIDKNPKKKFSKA